MSGCRVSTCALSVVFFANWKLHLKDMTSTAIAREAAVHSPSNDSPLILLLDLAIAQKTGLFAMGILMQPAVLPKGNPINRQKATPSIAIKATASRRTRFLLEPDIKDIFMSKTDIIAHQF